MEPHKLGTDDDQRRAAWKAEGKWFKANGKELDAIYDELDGVPLWEKLQQWTVAPDAPPVTDAVLVADATENDVYGSSAWAVLMEQPKLVLFGLQMAAKAIRFSTLEAICQALDCSIAEIMEFYMGKNTTERQNFIVQNLRTAQELEDIDI